MFRTKNDALGEFVRYKVRLVANGYSQVAEVDLMRPLLPWPSLSPLDAFSHSKRPWIGISTK